MCISQVGSRLIELLTQTAFIQPPADQLGDSLVDIRPAFVHTFKTVSNAKYFSPIILISLYDSFLSQINFSNANFSLNRNTSRRYGVIECDPLVLKGLERTVSNFHTYYFILA